MPLTALLVIGAQVYRVRGLQASGGMDVGGAELVVLLGVAVVWPLGLWALFHELVTDTSSRVWALVASLSVAWFPWIALTSLAARDLVGIALVPLGIALLVRGLRREGSRRVLLSGAGAALLVLIAAALVGASGRGQVPLPPESSAQAAGEVLLGTALRLPPAWLGAFLIACGVVHLISSGRGRFLTAGHVLLAVVYVLGSAPGIPWVGASSLTWLPSPALAAALLGISGAVLAGAGAVGAARLVGGWSLPSWGRPLLVVLGLLAMLVLSGRGVIDGIVAGVIG